MDRASLLRSATEATKQSEVPALKSEIHKLRTELSFQVSLNQRYSKELYECQRKLGIEPTDPQVPLHDVPNVLQLSAEMAYMHPLFLAYDQRIYSLDNMVDTLIDDLKELDKRSKHLVDDNAFLRQQLEQKNEQLLNLYKNGVGDDSVQGVFNKLQCDELNERLVLLAEENQLYSSKIKEYENKIYELQNKIEVFSRHEPAYINDIHELQEQLKRLEVECSDLEVKRDVLESKLKNQIELVAVHEQEKNDLASKLGRVENEAKVARHQVNNLKQTLQNAEEQAQAQLTELLKEIEAQKLRERDTFGRQMFLDREIDTIKDENRRIKKELEQCKSDLDQTLKMMDNYDNKVQILQKREEGALRLNKELREATEAAQLDREKLLLKEQQYERTLQNAQTRHREEVLANKSLQDKQIEQLKSRSRIIVEQKEDIIKSLEDELNQVTINCERLNRENKSIRAELTKLESQLKNDIEGTSSQVDDLLRQVTELTEKLHLSEHSHSETLTTAASEKSSLEQHLKNTQNSNADLRQALEQTRTQLTSATQELTTLKTKLSQLTRSNQNLLEELNKTKKYNEQRLEGIQDEYTAKLKNAQIQLDEAIKREKNSRERAVQLLQQYDVTEEKLKVEFNARIQELEYQLNQSKNQNRMLMMKQDQKEPSREYGTLRK